MKLIKNSVLFLFLSHISVASANNPIQQLQNKLTTITTSFFSTIQYFKKLAVASEQYEKRHGEDPKLTCQKCLHQASTGELIGNILGKTLKTVAEGNSNFEAMDTILEKYLALLSSGSPEDLVIFTLQVTHNMEISCSRCKNTTWEATTSKTE